MATPAVAGAVAILLQQHSTMTPDQVKARLMKTAYKMGLNLTSAYVPHLYQSFTQYYDLSLAMGSGLLNVQSAVNNNDLANSSVGAALSPYVTYNWQKPHRLAGLWKRQRRFQFSGLGKLGGLGNPSGLGIPAD